MKLNTPMMLINGYERFVTVTSIEETLESEETLMMSGTPFLTIDEGVYVYE